MKTLLKVTFTIFLVICVALTALFFLTENPSNANVEQRKTSIIPTPPLKVQLSEYKIVELVNEYRAAHGLKQLIIEPESSLCDFAKIRAEETSVVWKHFEKDEDIPKNIRHISFGENLAKDFKTEKGVLIGWVSSPGHLENIVNLNYTHTCVAIYNNNYVVQLFASY